MAGRPRTPHNLKVLSGAAARNKHRHRPEPTPEKASTEPPPWIADPAAREAYSELAGALGNVLTVSDTMALTLAAAYLVRWRELRESGEDPKELTRVGDRLFQLFKEFGMTPASRPKVAPVVDDDHDPLDDFMRI